ncbi:hypothetical protein OMK64_09575 [Cellulomonas fimi]|uniref:hypothetical protein n=1 Tax=Cellulomonas fimi TaxID=1708 RepID=UPI00234DBE5E|nr:hypothetical protein [Cellulomonas fimi]MDC7121787.1 hypothetical protein [Cellulomonas fimi]
MPRPWSVAVLAVLVAGAAAACSTSAPATVTPTGAPTSALTAAPEPSETLLPDADATASTVGRLADGFPADLLPVPAGAEVLVSSVHPVEGSDLLDVSLNLRSEQDAAALLDAVRAPLVAAGFAESAPPSPEGGLAAQSTFSRGDGSELLVVGVLDRDGVRTLTLGGQVRPTTA